MSSNIIDIYTRLEDMIGIKRSAHSNTRTEASNLKDELYKRGAKKTMKNIEVLSINYVLIE